MIIMPRRTNVVNMEVPEELADQIQRYMLQLQVTSSSTSTDEVADDGTIPWVEQVQSVRNHRIKQGNWEFQLKFASGVEWIPQDKCDCPDMISAYLKRKNIKTTHLFCRVSTKEQTSCASTSLPLQESKLREAVTDTTNRIVVHKISGSAYQRIPPQLMAVGEEVMEGDTIMVWRVDRLSRNIVNYLSWLEDLNTRGVNIVAFQEDLSYSHNKLDFIHGIVNAQKEAEILGSRIRGSYEHRRDRGDEAVGRLPWGKKYHRILSEDGLSTVRKLVVDNTEEIALTMRIRLSRARLGSLSDKLNREGKFKRGRRWSPLMIKRIKEIA